MFFLSFSQLLYDLMQVLLKVILTNLVDWIYFYLVFPTQSGKFTHDLKTYFIKDKTINFRCYFKVDFISTKNWLKKFSNNFICFVTNYFFMPSLLERIERSSLAYVEEIKLIASFNWLFHVSYFLSLTLTISCIFSFMLFSILV